MAGDKRSTNTEEACTVYGNKSTNRETRPAEKKENNRHAETIPRGLYNISSKMEGRSDQFILSLSPLVIISRLLNNSHYEAVCHKVVAASASSVLSKGQRITHIFSNATQVLRGVAVA